MSSGTDGSGDGGGKSSSFNILADLTSAMADNQSRGSGGSAHSAESTSDEAATTFGKGKCPLDGIPIKGKKRFCDIHQRAYDNLARAARKNSTDTKMCEEHIAFPAGVQICRARGHGLSYPRRSTTVGIARSRASCCGCVRHRLTCHTCLLYTSPSPRD
eukprot:4597116-Alexandrium_andersonii.AAC.1